MARKTSPCRLNQAPPWTTICTMKRGTNRIRRYFPPTGKGAELHPRTPGRDVQLSEPILGKDIVWFTRHALDRMKQRGVAEAEALNVLRNPMKKGLKTQPGRQRWRRTVKGDSIDVVFEVWPKKLCVVTVLLIE